MIWESHSVVRHEANTTPDDLESMVERLRLYDRIALERRLYDRIAPAPERYTAMATEGLRMLLNAIPHQL